MPMSTTDSAPSDVSSRLEKRLPTLPNVITGMVDLTGFLNLGNLFIQSAVVSDEK
jgi:uncharacterized membrane protein YoaK (UPF0700 family)